MPYAVRRLVSHRHVLVAACLLAAAAVPGAAPEAAAQGPAATRASGRAGLSEDLSQQLESGDFTGTTVIFTASQARANEVAARHNLRITKRLKNGVVFEVPAHRLEALASDPEVDHLSGNHRMHSQMAVTNVAIGADQVHAGWDGMPGLTGAGVGIAIVDSGIADVPQLRGRIVARVDFTDEEDTATDGQGHGTHVAGIAAASGVNAHDDTTGVAPGAHLVSLKVLDAEGHGYAADVVDAIDWVVANKDKYRIGVINLSLGGPVLESWRNDPVCQAVERAYRAGIVVVASAGNFGKGPLGERAYGGITMPGNSPFAITVGALNTHGTPWRSDDTRATYSSMGPTQYDGLLKPDLLAPGNRIRGLAAPGSTLVKEHPELMTGTGRDARLELSGTSMASAATSGAVALILSAHKLTQLDDVRHLVQATASEVDGSVLDNGTGSLNVLGATKALMHGAFEPVTIGGEATEPTSRSYCNSAVCPWTANTIVDGETIVWSEAQTIVWSEGATIVWSEADTIVWSEAGTIVWSEADTIVWSEAATIVWSE